MLGKFISETYNKVKSKADEVRLHVSVQAIKAKEVLGLVKPSTTEQLELLLNYELQQIDTAEVLIDTYKKWIYNIRQSEKSDCIRYYKSQNKNNEILSDDKRHTFINNVMDLKTSIDEKNNLYLRKENEIKCSNNDKIEKDIVTTTNSHVVIASNSSYDCESNTIQKNSNSSREEFPITNKEKELSTQEKNSLKKENTDFKINNNSPIEKNKEILMNNIYDDHYGYNFKEIFLKSDILEKSISLILEKRNIRLSLVGPIEEEDLENPRTTILTMFKHCLIGNEKLHKDILFIILTTDKLFDNHKELFLELLSILKHDYLDIYLTNLRKIISAEVVCLKSKINSYDSQNLNLNKLNFLNNFIPTTNDSLADFEIGINDTSSYNDKGDREKYENERKQFSQEDVFNQKEKCEIKKDENYKINKEEFEINEEKLFKLNEENIYEENEVEENYKNLAEQSKENKIGFLLNEKEIIESNKIQQIKILASLKLVELHKVVYKILLLAATNREKRKIDIKVKLEELKKIMDVCKKDCDITLNDAEGSKAHLENVYVKELDLITNNINKKQDEIIQMRTSIDNLIKRKNELYKEYESVCKEIDIKNKELSKTLSSLSIYKKELNEIEDIYLNRLSNTSKAKHMHQERKLYISNLNNISDEILRVYENSDYVSIEELVTKSKKIKKPLKQVILKHLNYLKGKLFLLNSLLKFYVNGTKLLLEKNNFDNNLLKTKIIEEKTINNSDFIKDDTLKNPNDENSTDDIYEKEKKLKLLKYKKCYIKVIDQITKIWLIIQEFYNQNKEQIEEDDGINQCGKHIYNEMNEIHNSIKKFIMENNQIILSLSLNDTESFKDL